jgi:uncharacterized protein (DUF697 family)
VNKKNLFDYAAKRLKKTIMPTDQSKKKKNNKSERSKHADTVIRNHVIWSMGASFIVPIPIADVFAVSALQLDMIRQLCRVYDKDFSETQGKAIVTSLTSSTLARAGARSLIKLIPGIGTVIGGVTLSVFNGGSTYALGEVFKKHFESGGTILDFDTDRLKKMYKEHFENGKKVAEELRKDEDAKKAAEEAAEKEPPVTKINLEEDEVTMETPETTAKDGNSREDTVSKLREIADLKEQGVISEKEFEEMKKKLIEGFGK